MDNIITFCMGFFLSVWLGIAWPSGVTYQAQTIIVANSSCGGQNEVSRIKLYPPDSKGNQKFETTCKNGNAVTGSAVSSK